MLETNLKKIAKIRKLSLTLGNSDPESINDYPKRA